MTENQFINLAASFADYAFKRCEYSYQIPGRKKGSKGEGVLRGLGVGVFANHIIISHFGETIAIPYEDVRILKPTE